jgi:ADP-heptose:LPS heptosyltransferase
MNNIKKILIIRRDNIGDLILSTPVIGALKIIYPQASIDFLVHTYTVEAIQDCPLLDRIWVYEKGKFAKNAWDRFLVYLKTAHLYVNLRRQAYDLVFLLGNGESPKNLNLLKIIAAKQSFAFGDPKRSSSNIIFIQSNKFLNSKLEATRSAVIESYEILSGLQDIPPVGPLLMTPNSKKVARVANAHPQFFSEQYDTPIINIHLSARRPSQRWGVDEYFKLIQCLSVYPLRFLITWSPGPQDDPRHPGDDEKSELLRERLSHASFDLSRVLFCRTTALAELMAALSFADGAICPDGGAMHVNAGLGNPVVALFGDSDLIRWRPWGVPYTLMHKPTQSVMDILPEDVAQAVIQLFQLKGKI